MKTIKILPLLLLVPVMAFAASRGDSEVRVGVNRISQTAARVPTLKGNGTGDSGSVVDTGAVTTAKSMLKESGNIVDAVESKVEESKVVNIGTSSDCRDAYQKCMDNFCLLDESQGERCACSDNIERAKPKISEVLKIQEEADRLYTEGVEREQLGAKARLVFKDSENTNQRISSTDFLTWVNSGSAEEDGEVGEDIEIGDGLYDVAKKFCKSELAACSDKIKMEETLYSRKITQDCKTYDSYLKEQKANAESNKRIAESAVRKARLEMLDTTNKYNRGECLLAYRSCVADKGGCGANFENCLDAGLLQRRANACDNILDQCLAVRNYVIDDWAEESKTILEDAAKYADENKRGTCLARVQNCLEEN